MTAAADFQPETDAPETAGADENQTPAVDDDAATATDVTADSDAAAPEDSESAADAPADDAAETEQPSDETPAEESAPADVDVEVVEIDVVEVVEDSEVVAVEVIEVAEVVEDGEVVAVEVVDVVVEAAPSADEPWGRVDEDGTVSVREADGWRVVGQYPDGSAEEALAYFERKYTDLASEVTLLEVRHRRGGASASDLRSTARTINGKLDGAAAVGDLASLVARVAALTETLAAESATEAVAAREAVDDAVKARTELVDKAEALAARDPRTCLLYTSPSPRDLSTSRMPSSA